MLPPGFKLDKKECGLAISDPDTPATVLHAILVAAYGLEYLYGTDGTDGADPLDIWLALRSDFKADISEEGENRINAMLLAVGTEAFFESPQAFVGIVKGLVSGDIGDVIDGAFDGDLTIHEIAAALWEIGVQRDYMSDFEPAVLKLLHDEVLQEAADIDGTSPEDKAGVHDFMRIYKADVLDGLRRLGVPEEAIAQINAQEQTRQSEAATSA
jgi:hypothetical protein